MTTEWVTVPREPTEAMVAAGRSYAVPSTQAIIPIYTAMLSASPPPISLEEIVEVLKAIDDLAPMEINLNNYTVDDVNQLNSNASYAAVRIRSLLSRLASMGETK